MKKTFLYILISVLSYPLAFLIAYIVYLFGYIGGETLILSVVISINAIALILALADRKQK